MRDLRYNCISAVNLCYCSVLAYKKFGWSNLSSSSLKGEERYWLLSIAHLHFQRHVSAHMLRIIIKYVNLARISMFFMHQTNLQIRKIPLMSFLMLRVKV